MCDDVKFSVMSSLFGWMQRSKTAAQKRLKFRKFLDHFCKPGDYFGAIRLILPSLDRERGSYGLKESVLATCLIDALGMARDSEDAVRLINWRKGGAAKAGANAGNFAAVASEVLQRRQGMASGGLTIMALNELLDSLASCEGRAEKASVLGEMIRKTNAQEMKWIVMIILKDLKLGVSEKSIFHEFHPDAEDLFNVTCDLKLVCEKLSDRSRRHKRQDIEVGKPVRPQLAMRVGNAAAAWKKMHGKEVVVECKFDGDRIQIHKNGSEIHFFSRNFIDHPEYEHGMSNVIIENVLVDRCIIDGEMLVWDTSVNCFAEFGSNQEIAKAAREGLESDRQLCYVAFDILYAGDTSVIHQSLRERHELLRKVVMPLKGRFELLVPNSVVNKERAPGEPCWSLVAHNVGDVEKFFKETIENRDEGIVLKDLGSKWEPSDRSGKWLKLKPDYIRAGSDLDVLIIGGYYGSGRRGGEVAQFLVGLAENAAPKTYPRRFVSFCRVGNGLSDEELDELISKLKPYYRKYEYPKKAAPSFYQVTNNSKERPDVWIENPEKSIILAITSDIRTVRSEVFAAPYSLRFPRIDKIRYDKPWHECLDVQSFIDLVHSSNGTTQKAVDNEIPQVEKPKSQKSLRRTKNKLSILPSHLVQTDISEVKGETSIFSDLVFYFVNVPPSYSLESLHKMVIENGGTFSMNLSDAVTHCIAAESKGIKYEAVKSRRDVIHYSWLLDCCTQNKIVQLQPKYFLFLSDSTRKKLQDEIDAFSDSYFSDLTVKELKQILGNAKGSDDIRKIEYYKRKYCPSNKWCYLGGCCIYFHPIVPFASMDWEDVLKLALRRMSVEVSLCGAKVSGNLSQATHLVVVSVPGFDTDFQSLSVSIPSEEKRFLHKKGLFIVPAKWLEDCFYLDQKLQEADYNLKPDDLEVFSLENEIGEVEIKESEEEEPQSPSPARKHKDIPTNKGKRGRSARAVNTRKRKAPITPTRRTRARVTKRPAKINEGEEFETNSSHNKMGNEEKNETAEEYDLDPPSTSSEMWDTRHEQHQIGVETCDVSERKEGGFVDVNFGEDSVADHHGTQGDNDAHDDDDKGQVNPGKSEFVVDPVQAILLDMLPSLRMEKTNVETSEDKADVGTSKDKADVDSSMPVPAGSKAESSVEAKQEPVKKKKVSYKDVASQLLQDW